MIQKLKTMILTLMMSLSFAVPLAATSVVSAAVGDTADIKNNLCQGAVNLKVDAAGNCVTDITTDESSFNKTLAKIINIISIIVGVVAVIMIIYGGFRYITSGGTSEKVTTAKNTILYGLIGLIIVALAQVIVKFVLKQTETVT